MILFSSDYRVITDHGKEARFPFLDEDVVSYLQSLPVHIKVIVFSYNFYAPEIEDRGAYCFCPVCHSVLLSETLTLLINF